MKSDGTKIGPHTFVWYSKAPESPLKHRSEPWLTQILHEPFICYFSRTVAHIGIHCYIRKLWSTVPTVSPTFLLSTAPSLVFSPTI